jgi:hypothetical protein
VATGAYLAALREADQAAALYRPVELDQSFGNNDMHDLEHAP